MPLDRIKNRLGYQLLAITLLALAAGVGIFFAARAVLEQITTAYLSNETVRQERLEKSARSLEQYVMDRDVALGDKEKLDAWVASEMYVMLQVYRDDMIMYDSSMDENMAEMEMPGGDAMQWQRSFTIPFADGNGQAILYGYYHMEDYQAATITAVVLGAVGFALVLLLLVGGKIRYIRRLSEELHILEGGDLTYNITVKGRDELGDLARSIDDMRLAIIRQQNDEAHAREMNRDLVTAMSHDLRSPLTSLIGYLDILELGRYKTEEERERFLRTSRSKAYQIKELSDKLFEYFLLYDSELENPQADLYECADMLRELIEDNVFELQSAGFTVEYTPLKESCGMRMMVDKSLMRRAFDNLFVNIRKYADMGRPVRVVCGQEQNDLEITIGNAVKKDMAGTSGTKIGLKLAKRIFDAYQGQFDSREEDGYFTVHIVLHGQSGL